MIVRMIGSDAEVEFPPGVVEAVQRLEGRFPCPEWAVVYQESPMEEEPDVEGAENGEFVVVCRRYGAVLIEMVFLEVGEIAEMDADGYDWVDEVARDLALTQDELERMGETTGEGGSAEEGGPHGTPEGGM